MTPALVLLFGIAPVTAIATDLVFAFVIKLTASRVHSNLKTVNWRVARQLWKGSVPGAVVGVAFLVHLPDEFIVALTGLVAIFLVIASVSMLTPVGTHYPSNSWIYLFGGAVVGFAVAATSVGAGAIGMVLLTGLIGNKDPRKLVGTDIVHSIPIALIAGATYVFAGFLDLELLSNLLIGGVPGVLLGAKLVGRIDAAKLKRGLAVVLLAAAFGMIQHVLSNS